MRKIIHIDMDCFYAAIEVRDDPSRLAGRPVAVGGEGRRGVLTTCSYEARKFGVKSAMPTFQALALCPDLILVPPHFEKYSRESEKIQALMLEVTPLVEPISLDEAYLDVTDSGRFAWDLAKELRARILAETGLTASAGIAPNKLVAKIASDWRKPNGQFAVLPDQIRAFMNPLPVGKLWGVGPKTTERLTALGLKTCADLVSFGRSRLLEALGNLGADLFEQAQGIDDRAVEPNRISKSLSNERTFEHSLRTEEECVATLPQLFSDLQDSLHSSAQDRKIAKLFVRLKFSDFQKTSRECVGSEAQFSEFARLLREALERRGARDVRLIGLGVRFVDESEESVQLEFDFVNEGRT